MNPTRSSLDYSKFKTLPCYFSTNAYGTPRTIVDGVQFDDFFQAIEVAVAENVDADIGPNLQYENLNIGCNLHDENQYYALNFQDENVHIGLNLHDENMDIATNLQNENLESTAGLNLYIGLNLEDVNADICPNLQDENMDIAPNLQDENVEDERLDPGAPTSIYASLDIGMNMQNENLEDEELDHGASPSHASPSATITEDRHRKTLQTIEVNINDYGTRPLKRSIGDAAAYSNKKKLKIDGDATADGGKKKLN
ncbi:unnamed protein product [Prunus armeniaca]|uniref:Uncharacterized protein n=1 Tax=Prunus armeniaca TaxID=36596 RepID=A0A6J5XWX8_PRUAR|nr:unnamed protein product [Prunus armeniaca]